MAARFSDHHHNQNQSYRLIRATTGGRSSIKGADRRRTAIPDASGSGGGFNLNNSKRLIKYSQIQAWPALL